MAQRVNLPPGCMGFKAEDGTRYVARPGTHVMVEDHHMAALKNNDYAQAGLVDAGSEKLYVQDKKKQGRWCRTCNRLWHAWAKTCSKCGAETILEGDMEKTRLEGQYIP